MGLFIIILVLVVIIITSIIAFICIPIVVIINIKKAPCGVSPLRGWVTETP